MDADGGQKQRHHSQQEKQEPQNGQPIVSTYFQDTLICSDKFKRFRRIPLDDSDDIQPRRQITVQRPGDEIVPTR